MEPIITQDIYYKCHEHSHEAKLVLKNRAGRARGPGADTAQHRAAGCQGLPTAVLGGSARYVSEPGRARPGPAAPGGLRGFRCGHLSATRPHGATRPWAAARCPPRTRGTRCARLPALYPGDAHGIASAPRAGARLAPSSGTASRVPTETCDKVTVQLQSDSLVLKLN